MSVRSRPSPVFEVDLRGAGEVPFGTLSRILKAIERLTLVEPLDSRRGSRAETPLQAFDLLEFSSSNVLPIHVLAQEVAIRALEHANSIIRNTGTLGDDDHILDSLKILSAAARSLACSIVIKRPGSNGEILAVVQGDTYSRIAKTAYIHGETSILARVERVGITRGARCEILPASQARRVVSQVQSSELARRLGRFLGEEVLVHGRARWLLPHSKIVGFTIRDFTEPIRTTLAQAIEALREAGGDGWDAIDDPVVHLEEMTG